jgi:hypothetical protein
VEPAGRLLRARPAFAVGFALVLVLSAANAGFLYLLPDRADSDYAWPIRPPVSAAFLGAGYVAGLVVALGGVLFARSWRSIRLVFPGVVALAVVLILATLIHRDRFDWEYPLTWGWTAVYALIPPGFGGFWWLQERAQPRLRAEPRLELIRAFALVLGAVLTLLAVLMFALPDAFVERWPWAISPLLSRAFAAWYALFGVILLDIALTAKQSRELVIPSAAVLASALLLLSLPLRFSGDMDTGRLSYWLLLLLHLALAAGAAWMLASSYRWMRESGELL